MNFLQPLFLVLLLPVIALAISYVVLQQRRRHYAVRFTNLDLLSSVAPKRPGWRRHVPAAAVGIALMSLVVGLASPVHETNVADESRIVMLAIDVSRSMEATDVAPSRLEAASEAAAEFVRDLPDGIEVGLVSFSSSASVLVAPTTDHRQVEAAIGRLRPEEGTATGDAILVSLRAIEAARAAAGVDQSEEGQNSPDSAAIVLLADGAQQLGVSLDVAAEAAQEQGVPVSTITFGTPEGTVTVNGQVIPVPPDPVAMAAVAEATGGVAFDAQNIDELKGVYSEIQGDVGYTLQESALWPWFIGLALLLLLAASAASIVWTGRFL
jgi:Ca-activated chloride channel family protein